LIREHRGDDLACGRLVNAAPGKKMTPSPPLCLLKIGLASWAGVTNAAS
jgi:hypothetical protein